MLLFAVSSLQNTQACLALPVCFASCARLVYGLAKLVLGIILKSRKRKITIYSLIIFLFPRALCDSQSVSFHAVYTQKLLAQALFLAHAQIIARSLLDGFLALIQSKESLPDCFQTISIFKVQAFLPPGPSSGDPRRHGTQARSPSSNSHYRRFNRFCKRFNRFFRFNRHFRRLAQNKALAIVHIATRSQALVFRILSIFNVILSVCCLFCVLSRFGALAMFIYGLIYLALYARFWAFARYTLAR